MQEAGFFAERTYIFLNNGKVDFNFCENMCDSEIQDQILLSINNNSFPHINNQLRILLIISKMYRAHFFDSICYKVLFKSHHSQKKIKR